MPFNKNKILLMSLVAVIVLIGTFVFWQQHSPSFDNASLLASYAGPGVHLGATTSGYSSSGANHVPVSNTTSQTTLPTNTYLIKSYTISMAVTDPMTAYNQIQAWITQTDSRAISNGANIQSLDQKGTESIDFTYSVQATLYPQIVQYLNAYASNNKGQMLNSQESVQDVTGQYVDTQAKVSSLQAELQRLHDLLSHAQSVSDIISIDQELTNLETQLNETEAQLNTLSNQVTMYNVHISLTPLSAVVTPPSTTWSFLDVVQSAWHATLALGQLLLTWLIWLVIFGVYIVPLLIIVFFARRWFMKRAAKEAKVQAQ